MPLPPKALAALKQIYAHFREEDLVDENPDEALESVLDEIVETLADRQGSGAPVDSTMHSAIGTVRRARRIRREAKLEVS